MMRLGPLLLPLLLGCSGETSLGIRLVADPSEQQILSEIDTIELVLDAPDGFVGADEAGQRLGRLQAVNNDADDALELLLRKDVRGHTALPLVRLLPGRNASRAFRLTVSGKSEQRVAAFGGTGPTRFVSGKSQDLLVPFTLRESFYPPHVKRIVPFDGAEATTKLGQVQVYFSKQIVADNINDVITLTYGKNQTRMEKGKWTAKTVDTLDARGFNEQRTVATFDFGCAIRAGTFRVQVSTKVVDLSGKALDQDISTIEREPYQGSFVVVGDAETPASDDPCTSKEITECVRPEECGVPLIGGMTCNEKGRCVSVNDCSQIDCGTQVCQPVTQCSETCDEACVEQLTNSGQSAEQCCERRCTPTGQVECVDDCNYTGCVSPLICDSNARLCVDAGGETARLCAECDQICAVDPSTNDCRECRSTYGCATDMI